MASTDVYPYVATRDIYHGGVCAYRVGDPVPSDNAKEHGYLDDGAVVARDEFKREDSAGDRGPVLERGEMPAHLRNVGSPEPATGDGSLETSATATKRAGGTKSPTKG